MTIGFCLSSQNKLSEIRSKLVGIHIEDPQFIDTIGRVVEVLGIRAFEIPIEVQTEPFRELSLFDRLFSLFEPERNVFKPLSNRARCVLGRCVGKEGP